MWMDPKSPDQYRKERGTVDMRDLTTAAGNTAAAAASSGEPPQLDLGILDSAPLQVHPNK